MSFYKVGDMTSFKISECVSYSIGTRMCSVSTNGERASLANLKLTIGSL